MKLSKVIPSHRKTVEFLWCKNEFMEMSDRYRKARGTLPKSRGAKDSCFWCGYKFKNGDMMALAKPIGKTNKILCQSCATELCS